MIEQRKDKVNSDECEYLAIVGAQRVCRHCADHRPGHVIALTACTHCPMRLDPAAWPCERPNPLPSEEEILAQRQPPAQPARGFGDAVARFTQAIGIKPCAGCKQRQAMLNRWLPSRWTKQLAKVTFGITAFERPRHLERLVASIEHFYPGASIVVADNGRQRADLPAGVKLLELDYDCGLSAAREALVAQLETPYLLVLEDDFVFLQQTKIERLLEILHHDSELGCIGGSMRVGGEIKDYDISFDLFRGKLTGRQAISPLRFSPGGTPYRYCDKHLNFGLWRREMLADHSWTGLPKLGEHAAYFWRVKQAGKWRVGHTPAAVIDHDQSSRSNDYRQHRGRASIMQGAWFREQGISGGYRQDQALGRAAEPALAKPNVLILGVGHSGTSILAQMLFAAGWRRGDADEAFGESVSVRCVNQSAKRGQIDLRQAKAALAQLPEPWALKDPRFHITLPAWLPLLAELQRPPLLVWLRRDSEQVAASYVTRGELSSEKAPLVVRARYAQCRRLFELWPWARVAIDYEQLAAAAGLFEQC